MCWLFCSSHCHLASPFAPVIITTATRGHRLTIDISMSGNKQLAQITYIAVFDEDGLFSETGLKIDEKVKLLLLKTS